MAEKRFGDAKCLRDSGQNNRASGAIYMAGFVMECLLKGRLMRKYPWLPKARNPDGFSTEERRIWSLCYRSHDLNEILECLPEVYNQLDKVEHGEHHRLKQELKSICARWTIQARYSPLSASIAEAGDFVSRVKEIKQWLSH